MDLLQVEVALMATNPKRSTTHHLFWPKKNWHPRYRKHQVKVSYLRHMSYHDFFMHSCRKKPHERRCLQSPCEHTELCVYFGTVKTF